MSAPTAFNMPGERALVQLARKLLAGRMLRSKLFPNGIFCEPAWDMLLSLYAQPSGGRRTVANLAESSGAPISTAVRWIKYLEEQDLVMREPLGVEIAGETVHLTDKAYRSLQFYLAQMLRDGH